MNELVIQNFPENGAEVKVDFMDPGRIQFCGLYRQSLVSNGIERDMYVYIAENMHYNCPCLIIAQPAVADTSMYLVDSGLKAFADQEKIMLCILKPIERKWNKDGSDAEYMNAAYKKVQQREYYVIMQDCIYAMGVDDGVDIAFQAVMNMTTEWSGIMTFGNVSEAVFLQPGKQFDHDKGIQKDEMMITGGKAQLPVWMFLDKTNIHDQKMLEYWEEENKTVREPLYDSNGTAIYMPRLVCDKTRVNNDNIAQVRLTGNMKAENISEVWLEYGWDYIGLARRHRGYKGKDLRYFRKPEDHGAEYHSVVVDGMRREWYEYVPSDYEKQGEALPLVVVMHGRGGNGETFFDITDMSLVAEERKFIAVFPTADIYQVRENGLRSVRLWNGNYGSEELNSLPFIRKMIEDIGERRNVDKRRIFACGQSSGGYMTAYCALAASDIFAAVAPWSGFTFPGCRMFPYKEPEYFTGGAVPFMLIVGTKDNFLGRESLWPLSGDDDLVGFVRFLLKEYRLNPEPYIYECKPITWHTWVNQDNIPMVKIGLVKDMPHANYAEESWITYDQFFAKYSRDESGNRYYESVKIVI